MTSLTRVRRLERVLADWFEKSTNAEIVDGSPQLNCVFSSNPPYFDGVHFSLRALAEELDMELDGILHDEWLREWADKHVAGVSGE